MQQTPTVEQLYRVSNFASRESQLAPNLLHLLGQLFEPCRTDWISDFFFEDEEPRHVHYLTAPNLLNSALLCHARSIRAEALSMQPDPIALYGERQHLTSRYLFVPAHTTDVLTLGYGVMYGLEERGSPHVPENFDFSVQHLYDFRFLWNKDTRTLLMVNSAPQHDCMVLYYSRQVSTTKAHSFTARFKRSVLLDAFRRDSGAVRTDKIVSALLFILEEDQYRSCPICGCGYRARCDCTMPSTNATNPLNYEHFRKGFLQDFGTFEGAASKLYIIENGRQVKHAVLGIVSAREGITDVGLVRRLSTWSVTRHVGKGGFDPKQPFFLTGWPHVSTDWLTSELDERSDMGGGGGGIGERFGMNASCPSSSSWGNMLLDGDEGGDVVVGDRGLALAGVRSVDESDGGVIRRRCRRKRGGSSGVEILLGLESGRRAGGGIMEEKDEIAEWEWNSSGKMMNGGGGGGDIVERGYLLGNGRYQGSSGGRTEWDIIGDIVKLEKIEKRKEANRASARRSNESRRQEREGLKGKIQEVREKVEGLRKKEARLRQENVTLKDIVKNVVEY